MEDCLALPGVGTCTCGLWLPPNKTLGEPRETRADVMRRPMDSSMGTGFDSRWNGGDAGGVVVSLGALSTDGKWWPQTKPIRSGKSKLTSSKKSNTNVLSTTAGEHRDKRSKYLCNRNTRGRKETENEKRAPETSRGVQATTTQAAGAPTYNSNATRRSFMRLADELPKSRVGGRRGNANPGKTATSRSWSWAKPSG